MNEQLVFFKALWDGCMPKQLDMPEDNCFIIWIQSHHADDIDKAIRKAGRKFSRYALYDVPLLDDEAPQRYVSSMLGHASTQRLARELRSRPGAQ